MADPFARCRACGAPLLWAETQRRYRIPLNAEPVEGGNIVIDEGGRTIVLGKARAPPPDAPTYTSHFATCPKADQFKKRRS